MNDIDISIQSGDWPDLSAVIERAAQSALAHTDRNGELSIVLADNDFVQNLNKTYRHKDKPTNVLSFPQDEAGLFGDVILALETVEREATEQNKTFEDHLVHLIIHGTLHLFGYDHENDHDAEKMEALEIKILEDLGVKNPYETQNSVT